MELCKSELHRKEIRLLFLHHSTGQNLWDGNRSNSFSQAIGKICERLAWRFQGKAELPSLFQKYNNEHEENFIIEELTFPKMIPYGWKNYPFDYYNIWVKNAGENPYQNEPTLELLTKEYQVIIFKHCFPVSNIQPDKGIADINSEYKSIENYKLQYLAVKKKLYSFPFTKFILFTGPAQLKCNITEIEAIRAKDFFNWVKYEWKMQNDNIFIWDLHDLQTEGKLYLKDSYARSANDSHPNIFFSDYAVNLLFNRIIDVITTNGAKTNLDGGFK